MNGKNEGRGIGRNSGNQISDGDRGLLSPGRTSSPSKQSYKEQGTSSLSGDKLPPVPQQSPSMNRSSVQPQSPMMSREDTELLLQLDVQTFRPIIPSTSSPDYVSLMRSFDSSFFGRGSEYFNFRGRPMRGWEVNYYFIAMAMANQGYSERETLDRIWQWNAVQALSRGSSFSAEMTSEMWFAAQEGYRDEILRLQPSRYNRIQMSPPGTARRR